jgi:hypothetical protein
MTLGVDHPKPAIVAIDVHLMALDNLAPRLNAVA